MWWCGSPCATVLPKERKLFVRCDGVLLGRDRDSSSCNTVEDHNVSPDSLALCPLCSPYVQGVEGFKNGVEGVPGRGFDGARKPSYSKKSSWAPAVGFSLLFFLSEDAVPLPLENMLNDPGRSVLLSNPLLGPHNHVSKTAAKISQPAQLHFWR